MRPPVHLRPSSLAVVAAGGALGTGAREALSLELPAVDGVSVTILVINVVGAFLLGVLLDFLSRHGPDHGVRRGVRLLLGTGVLGGFTTYSTLATDTVALAHDGRAGMSVVYASTTLLLGALASWLGIVASGQVHARSGRAPS